MTKRKILLVDDEIDFLEVLKSRLEANNYLVVTASDGEQAIQKVKAEKPDAVIMDIMMPHMDGISALKKIREIDERLPIFIVTAYSNEERVKVAGKFNASGFILKNEDLQPEIDKITATIEISEKYKEKK